MRVRTLRFALLLAPLVALSSLASCEGGTGSHQFSFTAAAGGIERDGSSPYAFTNEYGWAVTLTKAKMTFGPIYLNTVTPLRQQASLLERLRLVGVARASEESHLGEGRIVGQILEQISVDLLSPTLSPFASPGVVNEEHVGSGEVWFYPPPGTAPETTAITQAALDLAGKAERAGVTVAFAGQLVLDDTWLKPADPGAPGAGTIADVRQVRGIPASFTPRESDEGSLEIRVDARALLANADFENLSASPVDPADGQTKLLVQSKTGEGTDQVMRTLYNALRASRGTYAFRWVPR